ncbi:MAG: VWA domain-containing protein [Planctomycetota bacterium]|nr:VWA domain-containing protein [Planctomycetota bacterium]
MNPSSRQNRSRGPWSFLISLAVHCVIVAFVLFLTSSLKDPMKTPLTDFKTVEFAEDPTLNEIGSGDGDEDPGGQVTESEELLHEQAGAIQSSDRELTETVVKVEDDRIHESADSVSSNDQLLKITDQEELRDLAALAALQNSQSAKNRRDLEAKKRALAEAKRLRELELFHKAKGQKAGIGGAKAKGSGKNGAAQRIGDSQRDGSKTFTTVTEGNVILVIDISYSMAREMKTINGEKTSGLDFVKAELINLIRQQLNTKIQFNVIAFGSRTVPWRRAVVPAGPGLRLEAIKWVSELKVEGGTNLHSALKLALADVEVTRIIVLSDGRPSVGLTKPKRILEEVRRRNKTKKVRIDTIRFQSSWKGDLLKELARQNGGRFKSVP